MLQMEMAFLVSIHILCRTFQTNAPLSNEPCVNKRNITFFASKPFLWQFFAISFSKFHFTFRRIVICDTVLQSFCIYEKSLWWIQMHEYIVIITLTCYAFAYKCILHIHSFNTLVVEFKIDEIHFVTAFYCISAEARTGFLLLHPPAAVCSRYNYLWLAIFVGIVFLWLVLVPVLSDTEERSLRSPTAGAARAVRSCNWRM